MTAKTNLQDQHSIPGPKKSMALAMLFVSRITYTKASLCWLASAEGRNHEPRKILMVVNKQQIVREEIFQQLTTSNTHQQEGTAYKRLEYLNRTEPVSSIKHSK